MGKRGFVSANREDSEAMAEVRRLAALLPPPASAVPIYENMIEVYRARAQHRDLRDFLRDL